MFRFSGLVFVCLIFVVSAMPNKQRNKRTDATFQDTVVSLSHEGKRSWDVQVEPPEDLDETDFDIDPGMKIWKSMTRGGVKYNEPEEDRDDTDHPAFSDVASQEPEQDENQAGAGLPGPHSEPEADEDEMYHLENKLVSAQVEPQWTEVRAGSEVRVHLVPEEDMDHLFHKDPLQPALFQDAAEAAVIVDLQTQRKYSEPEEDLDHLYH